MDARTSQRGGVATADFDEGSIKETGLDGLVILTVCLKYCRTEI